MTEETAKEKIPPLPSDKIVVADVHKKRVTQETLERAIHLIYERRPDFFTRSYQRDKEWEDKPDWTGEEMEEWIHDDFSTELHNYIRNEILKEVGVTDPMLLTTTQGCIFSHLQSLARTMYGMHQIGEKTSQTR